MRAAAVIAILWTVAPASSSAAGARASFLYTLSDNVEKRAHGWPRLSWDPVNGELYVVNGTAVNVFNDNGMLVHSFGDDSGHGAPTGVAVGPGGDIYLLARNHTWSIVRCNFRGEPIAPLALSGVPPELSSLDPSAIAYAREKLWLFDGGGMKVISLEPDGRFAGVRDLSAAVDDEKIKGDVIRDFTVDSKGNVFFTIATAFKAYVVTADGEARSFGRKGSSPGKFGVVGGIAVDDDGNVFVSDTLRAVVIVFDSQLNYAGEFGHRGRSPSNLTAPLYLAAGNGRVYVSQSVGGVKAYGVLVE